MELRLPACTRRQACSLASLCCAVARAGVAQMTKLIWNGQLRSPDQEVVTLPGGRKVLPTTFTLAAEAHQHRAFLLAIFERPSSFYFGFIGLTLAMLQ